MVGFPGNGDFIFKVGISSEVPPPNYIPPSLRAMIRRRAWKCLLPHTRKGWSVLFDAHRRDYLDRSYWTTIECEDPDLGNLASHIFWTCLVGKGHFDFGWTSPWGLAKNRVAVLQCLLG